MKLYSRRNQVCRERDKVVKRFTDKEACRRELEMVRLLESKGVSVAKVMAASVDTIVYEWIDGVGYHALVDDFKEKHARALVRWLEDYYEATGMLRGDVNLRNFIYLESEDECCGVDFEDASVPGDKEKDLGRIIAFAVTYDPPFTDAKKRCARLLLKEFKRAGADLGEVQQAYLQEIREIVLRRHDKHYDVDSAKSFLEDIV